MDTAKDTAKDSTKETSAGEASRFNDLSALDHMPGAQVISPDGIAGQLDMLGVRPHSDEVTHLVVRRGFLFQRDVLVPIDWVDQVSPETNQIHLKARVSQVASSPEYRRGPDFVGFAWNLATLPLRLPLQLLLKRWQADQLSSQERMHRTARRQRATDERRMRPVDPTAFDKAARPSAHRINLNTASKEELEEINGIGPSLAQAIIDRRPINDLEELIHSLQELSPQTAERLRKVTTL